MIGYKYVAMNLKHKKYPYNILKYSYAMIRVSFN